MHFEIQQPQEATPLLTSTWQSLAGTSVATAATTAAPAAAQYPMAPVLPHFGQPHAAAAILGQQPLQQLPRPFAAGDLCTSGAQAYTQECNTACASMTRQAAHCPAELSAAALYTGAAGWRLTGQQQQPAGGSGSLTAANSARAAAALPLASASASRTDFHPLNAEESDCRDAVAAFYLGGHCCSPSRGSTSSANAAAAAAAEAASRECQTKELAQLVRVANAIESLLGASAKRRAADSTSINRSSTGGASSAAAAATGAALVSSTVPDRSK